jgi:hypothetical protein
MFVVHTVNQLEEAVRLRAEEILVTGGLASNVHEAYLLKTCKGQDGAMAESSKKQQDDRDMDSVAHKNAVPVWEVSSLMVITGEYSLLECQFDPQSPSMILQRTTQH